MDTLNQLTNVMLGIITAGSGFRLVFCAVRRCFADENEAQQLNKRMKHSVIFLVLALTAIAMKNVAVHYFG